MKPSINASIEQLRGQMANGATGASPGSAGNIMPGPNMQPAQTPMGGPGGGTGPTAPAGPTLDSVRTHSLAIGGLKHLVTAGHIQPHHAKAMEAKSRAHIAAYNAKSKSPAVAPPRKFGALGGAAPMSPPGSDGDGY
jgi:hypothetical protein